MIDTVDQGSSSRWKRLHRVAEARREHLGIRQDGLRDFGGPSASWVRALPSKEGPPSARMEATLRELDRALGWPIGTSWRLARDEFVAGSPAALDEEDRLIVGDSSTSMPKQAWSGDAVAAHHEQKIRDFATIISGVLRAMDPESAERAMRDIARTVGLD